MLVTRSLAAAGERGRRFARGDPDRGEGQPFSCYQMPGWLRGQPRVCWVVRGLPTGMSGSLLLFLIAAPKGAGAGDAVGSSASRAQLGREASSGRVIEPPFEDVQNQRGHPSFRQVRT